MGSSVFHGGFSTFVSLSVLAPSKTYIFIAFYRLWFGIILFGMANGFFLLPMILSFVGPTETAIDPSLFNEEGEKETDFDVDSILDEDSNSVSISKSDDTSFQEPN